MPYALQIKWHFTIIRHSGLKCTHFYSLCACFLAYFCPVIPSTLYSWELRKMSSQPFQLLLSRSFFSFSFITLSQFRCGSPRETGSQPEEPLSASHPYMTTIWHVGFSRKCKSTKAQCNVLCQALFLTSLGRVGEDKSSETLSFFLEFWVFSLSFEFFPWVLRFSLEF